MMRSTDGGNDRQPETRWNNEWWNLEIAFLLVTYLNNGSVSRKYTKNNVQQLLFEGEDSQYTTVYTTQNR